MSVAAAIRISSPDEADVVRHAASFAADEHAQCYVITVVDELPYGSGGDDAPDVVRQNLALIEEVHACPVMQEGDDVALALMDACHRFGVTTLFVRSGASRLFARSTAERLLYLNPPFDLVVVGEESARRGVHVEKL